MSKQYHEWLGEHRPAGWENGNYFYLLKSAYLAFQYDATLPYKPGAIVTYNGKFYQRTVTTTGYSAGINPDDATFWQPSNPGRDLGDFATLAALQTAHPSPAAGSIATVEEDDAFYKWDGDNEEWVQVSGSGPSELLILFDSDLDTVSPPLLFKGPIEAITVDLPANLATYSFQARLSGGTNTALADIAALQSWINTNITTATQLWMLEIIVSYAVGENGEATLLMQYQKARV